MTEHSESTGKLPNRRKGFFFWIGLSPALPVVLFLLRGVLLSMTVAGYTWMAGYPVLFSPFSKIGLRQMELRHFRFYSNRHDLLLTAPSVRITVDPKVLFLRGNIPASIFQIDLHQPTLILHRARTGRWKVSFRFPDVSPFLKTNLRIFKGNIKISDELWKTQRRPAEAGLGPVNGWVDLSNPGFAKILMVSGENANGYIQIAGTLLRPTMAGKIAVNAYGASFAGIGDYWIHRGEVHLVGGLIDGGASLFSADHALLSARGTFHIRNGLLVYASNPAYRASGLHCDLSVNTSIIRVSGIGGKAFVGIPGTGKAFVPFRDAHTDALAIPFSGQGVIRMSGAPNFYFTAPGIPIDFSRLPGNLKGSGVLSLTFSGREPHYLLQAKLASSGVEYGSLPIGKLSAGLEVCDGALFLNHLSWSGKNRELQANGNFSQPSHEGWFSAKLAEGKETFQGRGLWQRGSVLGRLTGAVQNFPLHSVFFGKPDDLYLIDKIGFVHWKSAQDFDGGLWSSDFPFHVEKEEIAAAGRLSGAFFFARKPGEKIWAFGSGKIARPSAAYRKISALNPRDPPLGWSLGFSEGKGSFSAISPELLSFGKIEKNKISALSFAGKAEFLNLKAAVLGSAKGPVDRPIVSADLYAQGERFSKPVYFSGDLNSDWHTVSSKRLALVWGRSAYDLNGTVALNDGYPLDVKGTVIQGELDDWIRLLPAAPSWLLGIGGSLSGRFALSGSLKDPEGLVHLHIHDGSLWGQPIAAAYTAARIKNGIVYLNPVTVRNNDDYFMARGSIGMYGPTALTFDVPKVQLSDLIFLRRTAGVVLGTAEIHGRLSGFILSPSLTGNLAVSRLRAKYLRLDTLHADLDYRKGWFDIQNAEITSGTGRILGYVGAGFTHPGFIGTNLIFSGIDTGILTNLHELDPLGLLDGAVKLTGPLPAMNGNFDLKLSNERPVSGELAGTVNRSLIDFSAMNLNFGNGGLTGSGRLKMGQPGIVHVVGRNLDLAAISNLLHLPETVSGNAFLTGDIRASLENPEMTADVHVTDPAVDNIAASDFKAKLVYRNGALILQEGKIDVPHGTFELYGLLPVSIGSKRIKTPLMVHVKLDHQDLGVLSDFFPAIKSKGMLQADLQISKLNDNINVAGSAIVSNGKILPPMLSTSIENLNGTASLQNKAVTLALTGDLENPFSLGGTISLDPAISSDLTLSGNNLHLVSPSLFDMRVSTEMGLAGTLGDWALTGSTTINPASFFVQGFNPGIIREFLAELGPARLDETLTFGDNVQIHHPHLNLYAGGTLHAGGTGNSPQLSGELDGSKGTLDFLGYVFEIRKAVVKFSPESTQPYLIFAGASTRRIQGSQIFIRLEGYPNDLHLALNSYPPLTQDILSRTLVAQQPNQMYTNANNNVFLQQEAQNWLSTGLPSEVFFPVENVFSSALSLEEFSLQFLPTGQLGLQVGKSISPHFLLTYAQPLTGGTQLIGQQQSSSLWGLEYHLSQRVYLQLNTSNLYGIGGQVLSRFNF